MLVRELGFCARNLGTQAVAGISVSPQAIPDSETVFLAPDIWLAAPRLSYKLPREVLGLLEMSPNVAAFGHFWGSSMSSVDRCHSQRKISRPKYNTDATTGGLRPP